jgi:phage N-6-adenine-methyltransferase
MVRHYSLSDKDNWETPPDVVQAFADALGGFALDPCASPNTNFGNAGNYRLEDGQDGLELPWFGNVFINPPFSYKIEWLDKLEEELDADRIETAVMITPDATDTKSWWHEYIAENAEYICFRYGRLNFVNPDANDDGPGATFGTAFSVYGNTPDELLRVLDDKGHLVKTVEENEIVKT